MSQWGCYWNVPLTFSHAVCCLPISLHIHGPKPGQWWIPLTAQWRIYTGGGHSELCSRERLKSSELWGVCPQSNKSSSCSAVHSSMMSHTPIHLMDLIPGSRLLIFASRTPQTISKNDCLPADCQSQAMQGVIHLPDSEGFLLRGERPISQLNAPSQPNVWRKQEKCFFRTFVRSRSWREYIFFFRIRWKNVKWVTCCSFQP